MIRGATLICSKCCTLCKAPSGFWQLTYAHTLRILGDAVPHTLSGPFNDVFPARFPAPRTLCEGMIVFTSASTVYHMKL